MFIEILPSSFIHSASFTLVPRPFSFETQLFLCRLAFCPQVSSENSDKTCNFQKRSQDSNFWKCCFRVLCGRWKQNFLKATTSQHLNSCQRRMFHCYFNDLYHIYVNIFFQMKCSSLIGRASFAAGLENQW